MNEEPMSIHKSQRVIKWLNKSAVFLVALILTTAIILQGNFLEGLLKLLGVGASRLEQISITSVDDFFARSGQEWLANFETGRNQPDFGDTAPFNNYGGHPNDPGTIPGLLMPLWAGGDPSHLVTKPAVYTSAVIDLGDNPDLVLQSFTVLDYQPEGVDIIYQYRMASSLPQLDVANFSVLDMATVGQLDAYEEKEAILGFATKRYLQFRTTFRNFSPSNRPLLAEFNINYGPASEVTITTEDPDSMLPELPIDSGMTGDFNNDGVINSLDYAEFLRLWDAFQKGDSDELSD